MKERQEIFNKLKERNLIDEIFEFKCYSDHLFTYMNEDDVRSYKDYEISFIADDILVWDMTARDLLNLNRIVFLNLRIFDKDSKVIYTKMFNMNNSNN